jgi:phosphate acetyltransferase
MPDFRNTTFDEIELGKPVSFTRTVTRTDVDALALASGDLDPFHLDDAEAKDAAVPVAQAVGASLLVSGMLNRRMPGPGSVVVSEELEYRGKITVGDRLTAIITAREKRREGNLVVFDCVCENQDGERIVRGTATVRAPTRRIAYSDLATPEVVVRHGDVFARLLGPPLRSRLPRWTDRGCQARPHRPGAGRAAGEDPRSSQGERPGSRQPPHRGH